MKESEEKILDALEELGREAVGTIAKIINKDFSNTRKRLLTLWVAGKVRKEETAEKTYYYLPVVLDYIVDKESTLPK